ncbi:Signal transduction response regulator, receiver region domain protein [Candidatus Magnetoovum chiemensis]|nr:Signal transduction response regulator, receiver region domain protein [Candidatus Magnetoovum chiemensis]
MKKKAILVVDDEKNIRLTISQSLDYMKIPVETAANGEEALKKLDSRKFEIIFLDLKMPDIDGMEVLRRVRENFPDIKVIIITAHGSISLAVEAMKMGAIDFIQKPFGTKKIREVAERAIKYESYLSTYSELIEVAIQNIKNKNFDDAHQFLSKAIAKNPENPEAYNLLGAMLVINREQIEAQKFYRAALDIDPTYKPAWSNIERITSFDWNGEIDFGTSS